MESKQALWYVVSKPTLVKVFPIIHPLYLMQYNDVYPGMHMNIVDQHEELMAWVQNHYGNYNAYGMRIFVKLFA